MDRLGAVCIEPSGQMTKEKLGKQTKGINWGRGKQQRAKLAKKNGVKTAMEGVQRHMRGGD